MTQAQTTLTVRVPITGVAIIEISGEVTRDSDAALKDAYERVDPHARAIVLSFEDLEYMNSSGIGLLVTLLVRAQRARQRILACGLTEHYREIFAKTGLLVSRPNDLVAVFEKSSEHISPQIFGEITPTVGRSLNAEYEGYDGIILIGPFNCLPFRISEAILKPLGIQQGMPLLTYETDACAVAPAVLRQVDVHIQQVLEHSVRIQ